jgi:hypothetical protein
VKGLPGLLALLVVAGAFLLATGLTLPPQVASHFDGSGAANGFMSRSGYITFMVIVVVGLPALFVLAQRLLHALAPRYLNVPHREYWLAPERREATILFMEGYLLRFAWALVLFLCVVHWSVVDANRIQPPRLSPALFFPALVAFLLFALWWAVELYRRFPRPPPR